jgi:hypothetical protein
LPWHSQPEVRGGSILVGKGTVLAKCVARGGLWHVDLRSDDAMSAMLSAGYGRLVDANSRSITAIKAAASRLQRGDLNGARHALCAARFAEMARDGDVALAAIDRLIRSGVASRSALAQIRPELAMAKYAPDEPRDERGRWTDGGTTDSEISPELITPVSSTQTANVDRETSATASHSRVTIKHSDGTIEERVGGTRAWRNNNPGTVNSGDFATRHGAIGDDKGMAIFPDEQTGVRAQEALLRSPTYAPKTIDKAIEAWAPPGDGNDTKRYQDLVHQWTGLPGDKEIGDLTDEELARLMAAQRRMEGWKVGGVRRSVKT